MAIERTLVQIRERPMLDLFDLGLVVVRKKPVTLALAALLGIVPFYLFNLWVFSASSAESVLYYAFFLWMFEAPFATAPLTLILGGLMFGQRPRFRSVVGSLLRSSVVLIFFQGFLRYLLFFFIPTRLAFANPVILLERGRWWKILGRGADLSNSRGSELILLAFSQAFLTVFFTTAFVLSVSRLGQIFLAEEISFEPQANFDFASWRVQVPIWIVVAFFALIRFLVYLDQRIRLEGWEVELRLREVGRTLEEAERW